MIISKATLATEGDNLRFSVPFSKVDKERRIVSGFATLDNLDKQNDVVTTEASVAAFSKFRGNIREMHQPTAVGKMVNFKEERYFDADTKKFYSGVYVSAYVSKGAQNTWEKVLDGTLSGFSIGGRMNKWDDAYDEKADSQIRIIKDYDLVELSLVDNPANQFASIMSIEKNDNGESVIKGDLTETVIENVFWDKEAGIVILSEKDSELSPTSGEPMENIGFVEKNDNEKIEMIKFLVDSAKGIGTKIDKEVSPMTENTKTVVEEAVVEKSEEVAPEVDTITIAEKAESDADVEKADETEEVSKSEDAEEEKVDSEEDLEKSDSEEDAVKAENVETIEEVSKSNEVAEAVSEIKDSLATAFSDLSTVVKSLHEEIAELKKSLGEASSELSTVKGELTAAKSSFDEFGKRVDAVEADTAFRKSGDLGEIVQEARIEKSEQSLWGGRFLKTADLFN